MKTVYARKEVIVTAGAVGSPKLLMVSGIGPAEDLDEIGIKVFKNLTVGWNLQNHVGMSPVSVNIPPTASKVTSIEGMQNDVVYWLNTHLGPMSNTNFLDNIAFYQTSQEHRANLPDIKIIFTKVINNAHSNYSDARFTSLPYYNGFTIGPQLIAPRSRGFIKLNTTDPINAPPLIYANHLTDPRDMKALIEGVRKSNQLFLTRTFRQMGYQGVKTLAPECDQYNYDTDEYYECYAKMHTNVNYHLVGTCKMGPSTDPTAVVDSRLRVHGIHGLRVMDGSIMPVITRGNTNAPIIMIAEKGSDMIKEDWLMI